MQERPTGTCEECGSGFYLDASAMAGLCPECASVLYGYPPCDHEMVDGRCRKCLWDGSRSDFTGGLLPKFDLG